MHSVTLLLILRQGLANGVDVMCLRKYARQIKGLRQVQSWQKNCKPKDNERARIRLELEVDVRKN
jgi:hypothetical protein